MQTKSVSSKTRTCIGVTHTREHRNENNESQAFSVIRPISRRLWRKPAARQIGPFGPKMGAGFDGDSGLAELRRAEHGRAEG